MIELRLSSRFSWATGRPIKDTTLCNANHREVCSAPRRCGWPAAVDVGYFWSSCCYGRRLLPSRGLQQPGSSPRRCRRKHRYQRAQRSFSFGADIECEQLVTAIRRFERDLVAGSRVCSVNFTVRS